MIIYGLLKIVLLVLNIIGSIFGSLIPGLPSSLTGMLSQLTDIIASGVSFISYFFYWDVIVAILSIFIGYHAFKVIKDVVMKVIGHFIAN